MRTRFIVGNWKMNKTASEAGAFVHRLSQELPHHSGIQIGLDTPFTALHAVREAMGPVPAFLLGAQNLYWEDKGAFTGEVSGAMLKDIGCRFVLVGHSERRQYFGDQDSWTNKKFWPPSGMAFNRFCAWEKRSRIVIRGQTDLVIQRQLRAGLAEIEVHTLSTVTIAYEPVWAIGTGRAASPEQAVPVHQLIRRTLNELGGADIGSHVRILYGRERHTAQYCRFSSIRRNRRRTGWRGLFRPGLFCYTCQSRNRVQTHHG